MLLSTEIFATWSRRILSTIAIGLDSTEVLTPAFELIHSIYFLVISVSKILFVAKFGSTKNPTFIQSYFIWAFVVTTFAASKGG